jgi:hypothetical protein
MSFFHASPKDMAPRQRGDTFTPAVLERIRYRSSSVLGGGAGIICSDMDMMDRVRVEI